MAIGTISALDTWFAVANSNIMLDEQNPICLTLMRLEPNGMICFVVGKLLGTVMVLASLLMLHRFCFKHTDWLFLASPCFRWVC